MLKVNPMEKADMVNLREMPKEEPKAKEKEKEQGPKKDVGFVEERTSSETAHKCSSSGAPKEEKEDSEVFAI
jgi:hypothetical protein